MIPFQRVTGRTVAFEYDDCAVLACSIVLQIPYEQMHKTLSELGRKDCSGFRVDWLSEFLRQNGCELRGEFVNVKLSDLLPHVQNGRFLCRTKNHAFAVVHGVVMDFSEPNTKQRIQRVYEHKPKDNTSNTETKHSAR